MLDRKGKSSEECTSTSLGFFSFTLRKLQGEEEQFFSRVSHVSFSIPIRLGLLLFLSLIGTARGSWGGFVLDLERLWMPTTAVVMATTPCRYHRASLTSQILSFRRHIFIPTYNTMAHNLI